MYIKILERIKMKKFLIISGSFLGFVILSLVLMAIYMPPKEPTFEDCQEFGICKEGTKIIIDDEEVTITKEYCLKHHYRWDDEYKIGHIFETTY